MNLKIVMDSGMEYVLEHTSYEQFKNRITNQMGIVLNVFIHLIGDNYINPTHISSIEEIRT